MLVQRWLAPKKDNAETQKTQIFAGTLREVFITG